MKQVIIDGNGLFWRCYKAVDDLKYGGEYGFLRTFIRLALKFESMPIVCWDCYCGWRRTEFPGYKNTKSRQFHSEDRETINQRRNEFIQFLKFICPNVYHLDQEADDVMAYLAKVLSGDMVVYSNDHDMLQLINDRVCLVKSIFNFSRAADRETTDKFFVEINKENFDTTYGHPLLIEKYMMFLIGCTSDGIPGCSVHKQKIQEILLSCTDFSEQSIYHVGNLMLTTPGMNRRWNDFFATGSFRRNQAIMDLSNRQLTDLQTLYEKNTPLFLEYCEKRGFVTMLDELEIIKDYAYQTY